MEVPQQIHEAMLAHGRFCLPEEACGLIAADASGRLRMVYALTNVDRSPHSYTVAPEEHFGALRHAERNGWHLAGVFHSHPASAPLPSPTDLSQALEPEWLYAIVGLDRSGDATVRAFRVCDGAATEVPLEVVP